MAATALPNLGNLPQDYYVVAFGGFGASESISDLASHPYQLATSLNAIAIGRLKYCPRTVYMFFETLADAWNVVALVSGARRPPAKDNVIRSLSAAVGGLASNWLQGPDAVTEERPMSRFLWLTTDPAHTPALPASILSPDETLAATLPAPAVAASLPVPGFVPEPPPALRHSPSSAAPAPVNPFPAFAEVRGNDLPSSVPVAGLQMGQYPYTEAFRHSGASADIPPVLITRHHFFRNFSPTENMALVYLLGVSASAVTVDDSERLLFELETFFKIRPGLIAEVGIWPAYRVKKAEHVVNRFNIVVGFGDGGEMRRELVRRIPDLGQKIKLLLVDHRLGDPSWLGTIRL
ncbi:hypothetical protein JCM8202_002989 [Rhodotorula sphaerocarpa]